MTALIAGALFAVTVLFAIPTLRFGLAETARSPLGLVELLDTPVIGVRAREALLVIAPPRDAPARVAELTAILSQRPLATAHWLQLARARYEAGEAPEQVFEALEFSQRTGPNEASIMAGRAIFGLALWSLAPAKLRQALLRDLVHGWQQVSETRRVLLRVMFEEAAPSVRAEIADGLSAYKAQGAGIVARLGLADETPSPDSVQTE